MNTSVFRRDTGDVDHEAIAQRRQSALLYSIDMARRAASATLAASGGDPDNSMRDATLQSVNQRLTSIVRELQQLA